MHFGGLPPETGLGQGLFGSQGILKTAGVGDDMNEFGQHLRGERKGNLRLQDLVLQELVSGLVGG